MIWFCFEHRKYSWCTFSALTVKGYCHPWWYSFALNIEKIVGTIFHLWLCRVTVTHDYTVLFGHCKHSWCTFQLWMWRVAVTHYDTILLWTLQIWLVRFFSFDCKELLSPMMIRLYLSIANIAGALSQPWMWRVIVTHGDTVLLWALQTWLVRFFIFDGKELWSPRVFAGTL